jgi:hypothetical protein
MSMGGGMGMVAGWGQSVQADMPANPNPSPKLA